MHSFLLAKLRLLKPLFGQHRDNRNCDICARNFAELSQTTGETKHLHILATMHFTRSSESKKAFRSDTLQKRTFRWPCFYLFILLFFLDKFPSLFCRQLVHGFMRNTHYQTSREKQLRFFVTVLPEFLSQFFT